MSNNDSTLYNNLFSSLISEIKSYNGTDPLLPWLRGIRKMKETLPPQLLKEKLPRFLQKCSQTFLTDRRYSNDLRYLRVWLQLMDFVDDPKAVLRTMEMKKIGTRKSLFYQAYALYYEKMKKFDAAEKIYHLGVENLAEPADELQKSYEQFLDRLKRHKNKRVQLQGGKTNNRLLNHNEVRGCKEDSQTTNGQTAKPKFSSTGNKIAASHGSQNEKPDHSDDVVVVKFVDSAIVGKSNTEDSRHHGLLEPTMSMKEAMNAINSMFREPLEPSIVSRTSRNQLKPSTNLKNGYEVSTNESIENKFELSGHTSSKDPPIPQVKCAGATQPSDEPFEIYVDGEESDDVKDENNEKCVQAMKSNSGIVSSGHASIFARPNDQEFLKDPNPKKVNQSGLREDTVVYRFVGSTISDEPQVENVWHHGLVEPTINLKEAMEDINSMFGKPIEFERKSRSRKHDKAPNLINKCEEFLILPDDGPSNGKAEDGSSSMAQIPLKFETKCSLRKQDEAQDVMNNHTGFLILPDDEIENQQDSSLPSSSAGNRSDLFEQTLCTKEAMDEINKLFAMPMDF